DLIGEWPEAVFRLSLQRSNARLYLSGHGSDHAMQLGWRFVGAKHFMGGLDFLHRRHAALEKCGKFFGSWSSGCVEIANLRVIGRSNRVLRRIDQRVAFVVELVCSVGQAANMAKQRIQLA